MKKSSISFLATTLTSFLLIACEATQIDALKITTESIAVPSSIPSDDSVTLRWMNPVADIKEISH